MIVVFNPGSIRLPPEQQVIRGNPYMLVLDSLGDSHQSAASALRSYLRLEFEDKKAKKVMFFSKDKMPEFSPEVPMQQNSCDCGLFLLHYVELIFQAGSFLSRKGYNENELHSFLFQNPTMFYWPKKIDNMRKWFSQEDIRHKREEIALLIQRLSQKEIVEDTDAAVNFPDLKFLRRSSRRSRQNRRKSPVVEDPDADEDRLCLQRRGSSLSTSNENNLESKSRSSETSKNVDDLERDFKSNNEAFCPEDFVKHLIDSSEVFQSSDTEKKDTRTFPRKRVSDPDSADNGYLFATPPKKSSRKKDRTS